ncbi:MAG: hypothetical protein AB1486_16385 [Planctomycetota bacterium]
MRSCIACKKIFDRPKDIGDIKAMLIAQRARLDLDTLRTEAKQLLTDDAYAQLETLIGEFACSDVLSPRARLEPQPPSSSPS